MRKTLLSALVASAFALGGNAFAAPLIFDLDGLPAGNVISANSLDWAPTSFLAKGGVAAITAFDAGATGAALNFTVLTHAKLAGFSNANGTFGLPGTFTGEITIVTSFQERVTGTSATGATFQTTGVGFVEMWYSATANSNNLAGSNFNDGTLIMRARGVSDSTGNFTVNNKPPVLIDGFGANNYGNQLTVSGIGIQDEITFGSSSVALDDNFLKTMVTDFSLLFENISIGLPFRSVDPSDCFTQFESVPFNDASITANAAIGGATQCAPVHLNANYAANASVANGTGYVPVVGAVNGLFSNDPDFVAQTDFNSAVTGTAPEPGTLALLGLAFAGLGLTAARRKRV